MLNISLRGILHALDYDIEVCNPKIRTNYCYLRQLNRSIAFTYIIIKFHVVRQVGFVHLWQTKGSEMINLLLILKNIYIMTF